MKIEDPVPMNTLHEGEAANVLRILPNARLHARLIDLGLIEGTSVECVRKSPAGDPVAYRIRGAVIALRGEDSSQILVQRRKEGSPWV